MSSSSDLAAAFLEALDDDALDRLAERLAPRLARLAQPGPGADAWMDSADAAAYLGISRHALHRLTAERRVPVAQERPGARCYFRRADLDRWREQAAR